MVRSELFVTDRCDQWELLWIGLALSEACFDNESVENMTPMVVFCAFWRFQSSPNFHDLIFDATQVHPFNPLQAYIINSWTYVSCHSINQLSSTIFQITFGTFESFGFLGHQDMWVGRRTDTTRCSFGSDVGRVHQWFETFKGFLTYK